VYSRAPHDPTFTPDRQRRLRQQLRSTLNHPRADIYGGFGFVYLESELQLGGWQYTHDCHVSRKPRAMLMFLWILERWRGHQSRCHGDNCSVVCCEFCTQYLHRWSTRSGCGSLSRPLVFFRKDSRSRSMANGPPNWNFFSGWQGSGNGFLHGPITQHHMDAYQGTALVALRNNSDGFCTATATPTGSPTQTRIIRSMTLES
jgi:hypothetical protein